MERGHKLYYLGTAMSLNIIFHYTFFCGSNVRAEQAAWSFFSVLETPTITEVGPSAPPITKAIKQESTIHFTFLLICYPFINR